MTPDIRNAILAYNGAMICFSLMFTGSKILSDHMGINEILFFRSSLSFLLLVGIVLYHRDRQALHIQQPGLLLLRGLIGTVAIGMSFWSYSLLPLATVTTIFFTANLWIIPLSFLFLGEAVRWPRLTAAWLGFGGVLCMAHPDESGALLGWGLALATSLLHAILGTILRQLGRTENPLAVALSFMGIAALMGGMTLALTGLTVRFTDIPLLLLLGVTGGIGQYLMTWAYKRAEAQTLGPFNYLNLIWSSTLGYFVWGDVLDLPGWIGATIIIGSNVLVVLAERRRSRLLPTPATPV